MKTIKDLKEEIKVLSKTIHDKKKERKTVPNGYVPGLLGLRGDARYKHIAYCLLRGRTMEQIEQKTHDPVHMAWVERIMATITMEVLHEEAVCGSQD